MIRLPNSADHAGNAEKLGFPDAIHYERLDTRGPGEKGGINPRDDAPQISRRRLICNPSIGVIPPLFSHRRLAYRAISFEWL
jgi:hypothetical protein